MKTKLAFSCMVALMSVMLISTASAGALAVSGPGGAPTLDGGISICGAGQVYCNAPGGSGNAGNVDAWTINSGFSVSDSFSVTAGTQVNGAQFLTWEFPGDTLTSVQWTICANSDGGACTLGDTMATGVAAATAVGSATVNNYGFDVQEYQISFGGNTTLGSGTEWFQLDNAVVSTGDPIYWDENSGASLAVENSVGTIPSETFAILGGNSGVPEPGTLALFGSGVLLLGGLLRRRLR